MEKQLHDIVLATWNIGGHDLKDRRKQLILASNEIFNIADVEIMGAQEVPDEGKFLFEREGFDVIYGKPAHLFYNPIIYRTDVFEKLEEGAIELNRYQELDARADRTATWARMRIKATGYESLFVSVHADNNNARAKQQGVDRLFEQVPGLAGTCPAALVGDFNMNVAPLPDNAFGPRMRRHILSHGFIDALTEGSPAAPPRVRPRTMFNFQNPWDAGTDGFDYDLDHLYLRGFIHWLSNVYYKSFGGYSGDHGAIIERAKYETEIP
jgi:hypothetical protein